MALSTADTNKWSILIDQRFHAPTPRKTSLKYERTGPLRQRQRRLSNELVIQMAVRYGEGATVYELAKEFGIDRRTASERLKKAGVRMRLQPPSDAMIDEMVQLYQSGMSFAKVGARLNVSPQTVLRYVKIREMASIINSKST